MADSNNGNFNLRAVIPIALSAAISAAVAYFTATTEMAVEIARSDQRIISLERFAANGLRFTAKDGAHIIATHAAHATLPCHHEVCERLVRAETRVDTLEHRLIKIEADHERFKKRTKLER